MRRRTLLTAVLCTVLAVAAGSVSSEFHDTGYVSAETTEAGPETSGTKVVDEADGASGNETAPETSPETQKQTEAAPPETQKQTEAAPPETQKQTETAPPETQKQTEAAPAETQKQTETAPAETQKQTETAASSEKQTETTASSETTAETSPPETGLTEAGSTEGSQPETAGGTVPTEAQSESEKKKKKKKEETETETESESEKISNEELVARQKIVVPPKIEKEFRFTKVDRRYAIAANPDGVQIYEKKSADAREVGTLNYYGCCYILEDQQDGWYYVESGNVRGFVQADQMAVDEVADRIVKIKGLENLPAARLLVARTENAAFTYTHTTVQEVMADRQYALASGDVKIYEQKKDSSRAVGALSDQELCYILADADDAWVFVESGNARGFVEKSRLVTGQKAAQAVSEKGEVNMPLADVLVKPEENKACYYTLTSVKEASQGAKTREAMVNFAKQFLGNPYVWGGTSLTQGADCSGFVQSIYSYFGYSLPRIAEDQSHYGTQIPVSSAEPGDLIFYARNGYVFHVSMYIGGGQVIQAAGKKVGIITSGIDGSAVWATRVIQD